MSNAFASAGGSGVQEVEIANLLWGNSYSFVDSTGNYRSITSGSSWYGTSGNVIKVTIASPYKIDCLKKCKLKVCEKGTASNNWVKYSSGSSVSVPAGDYIIIAVKD